MKLVNARAAEMKRSTPRSRVRPATGMLAVAESVAANVTKPLPVTAAAPLEVRSRTNNKDSTRPELSGTLKAWATNRRNADRQSGERDERNQHLDQAHEAVPEGRHQGPQCGNKNPSSAPSTIAISTWAYGLGPRDRRPQLENPGAGGVGIDTEPAE